MELFCSFKNETNHIWSRYMSVVKQHNDLLLIRKNAQWDGDLLAQRIDKNCNKLTHPSIFMHMYECRGKELVAMTHNTAFIFEKKKLYAIGGQLNQITVKNFCSVESQMKVARNVGLWSSTRTNKNWTHFKLLDTKRKNCRDLRSFSYLAPNNECEFDGRLSVMKLNTSFFMYVRYNAFRSAGRFVSYTKSTDLQNWGQFKPIKIARVPMKPANEIYTFYAFRDENHKHALSLYPLILDGRAIIALSCSYDGHSWSKPFTLLKSKIIYGRVETHPVHGTWSDQTYLYILLQHNVPGVVPNKLNRKYQIKQYRILHETIRAFCVDEFNYLRERSTS